MSSGQKPNSEGLDALLDEALEEFESSVPVRQARPVPGDSVAPQQKDDAGTSIAGDGASVSRSLDAEAVHTSGKGLAFNPLGSRIPKKRGPGNKSSQSTVEFTAPIHPVNEGDASHVSTDADALRAAAAAAGLGEMENIDDLSAGLSKLLAELANVSDGEMGQAAADLASRYEHQDGQAQQDQHGDLASTLRALAEQSPSFEGEPEGEGDPLQQLGAHPEMASLVDSIMQQLLSKDVLYQPMKDIGERYPSWLEEHREGLPEEDFQRYTQQYEYIQKICALYESNPGDYTQLVGLLQQMQQCGQPPQEIVDELAPGMQFDPDGLPRFPGNGAGEVGRPGDLPPELAECNIM